MNPVAGWSYGSAALAFLLLAAAVATVWRGRPHGRMLALACMCTCAWAAACAAAALLGAPWTAVADLLEAVRGAAWTAFLFILLGYRGEQRGILIPVAAAYALYALAAGLREVSEPVAQLAGTQALVLARLGFAVLGMLLVEHLYRNKTAQQRWAIKFACMAILAMFVFDFYMYSDAALLRGVNPDIWAARGFGAALCAPLLAISVARSASWSTGLSVSRSMLFHSAALAGCAVYLLLMGTAGYFLRYFGGRWGPVMQLAFLFGAGVLLAVILFSGSFRAWLKVFISKHFYTYHYDYREEWMRLTRALSEHGHGVAERAIHALGALVESPGGALWVRRDDSRFELAAHINTTPAQEALPAGDPLCMFLEARQWVVDLRELAASPGAYDGLAIPAAIAALPRARLVVPLVLHGRLAGFMLLLEPRSRIALNWEVIDLLKIAGSQAASHLAQQEAADALMVARQFESFNRMSTFIVHDLKNLVSQLSLLSSNAQTHSANPEFQRDMAETVAHSVRKMKLLLQRLSRGGALERTGPLSMAELLGRAVALKAAFEPRPVLACEGDAAVLADAERLERVVGHLIQNAIEATPKEGRVAVSLRTAGGEALVEVTDTGAGMSEEFIRERLFKPFESTKAAGMGIGAFESREYIRELGGRLEVSSQPLCGTTFRIALPLHEAGRIGGADAA
ncbi:XrtA/PEP-CTERM system histidine kinase PrsK [Pseudoduganella sp. GCM10020061]|uniref:XrtA/PEP-CTERM system histidine kinase PrsK n=1 Tax=Pseudoduganella sp. GCM10020061 TaxID=3317345 RepID=UPI00363D4C96